jgi:general secretion pathway protein D
MKESLVNHRYPVVALALLLLAGCQSMPSRPADPFSGDSYLARAEARSRSEVAAEAGDALGADAAAPNAAATAPVPTQSPGSGSFINESVAAKVPPPAGDIGEVTFNFEGESLHAVIKTILGEILQQNYVIAPGVSGTVTFSTAKPLRGDQALSILEMLLRWNNATLVWQDGRYTILPIAQALPGNLTPRTGPVNQARGYEVRAVPLRFISVLEMEKVLKPYAKPEAIINIDPARNMIVLGGTRAELENYLQTVEVFDVDWLAGMSVGMYSLQQTEAAKVVTELEKIFGEGGNTPISGMFRFIPLEGVNGVMVITPQPKYLGTIEEWLQRFDLGSGEAGQRLYVYDVKNVKAIDLADTLNQVFGSGGGSASSRSSGGVAPGLQPVRIGSAGQRSSTGGSARSGAAKQEGAPGGEAGGARSAAGSLSIGGSEDVRISAVEEGNALLVRATAAQWESIRRVIERMDTIPLQVAIEAQIISVTLTDELQYGVRWFFENAISDELFGEGARDLARELSSWGDLAGSISGGTTSWTLIGPDVGGLVNLVDNFTDVKVLSAPSLVVLNNKSASINSGTQIPVTTTSINLGTGGTNTPIASTQYVQTGITLNVTPRVNPGGLVFLEIDQEDSSAGAIPEGGGNPPISQSTIQTEIAVQSGETVLLGGLIKQTESKGSSGVPGLSRLPVLGGLFGSKSRNVARQELLVLITPKVITGPQDTRAITEEYKRQFRALTPLPAPAAEAAPAD